ncbi:DUF6390 family protein [Saccharopolyspora rhizosphaerae]|uniref:DUF6390 family protein n=1 Tax=Saccharopolyspora rhizosphaerae TaxID=2492662 RepID=UPI0018F2CB5B|nr:DUF6390 family protein [Saccharopolyspora rhizosphaerae]
MHQLESGPAMFARYAYPPNELGYCGPPSAEELLSSASAEDVVSESELVRRARDFDGAWAYLEVISAGTGTDPLDPAVVEAYWIGSPLLEQVDPVRFGATVRARFADQVGARFSGLPAGRFETSEALPHHSFHVFEVYPWVGMLGRGDGEPALSVLDQCRIRWGRVLAVEGDRAVVRSRPLRWDGRQLSWGPEREERPRWADRGRSLLRDIKPGDQVSMHWDWVCDRLNDRQLAALRDCTDRQLRLTNRTLARDRTARTERPSADLEGS